MAQLLNGWLCYIASIEVPNNHTIWSGMVIPTNQFNAISANGSFNTRQGYVPPNTGMPSHVLKNLKMSNLGTFSGSDEENALGWINSVQNKFEQLECEPRFWFSQVSVRLVHDAERWAQG